MIGLTMAACVASFCAGICSFGCFLKAAQRVQDWRPDAFGWAIFTVGAVVLAVLAVTL